MVNGNQKWVSGQSTEGKEITITVPMKLVKTVSQKGNPYWGLANIGTKFGGEQVGVDSDGNRVMVNLSVYLKPIDAVNAPKSIFKIG